jgi:ElaB/YqjD/DUF883 family membrane-anchored ribosome-binding protein
MENVHGEGPGAGGSLSDGESGATFEEIRAMMQDTVRQAKENERARKEGERAMKEIREQMRGTDKKFGKLTNRFGEIVEHLVSPNLKAKFNALGFTFTRLATGVEISDKVHRILTEIDVLLENRECVMAVEVKCKPNAADITEHIERMEKVRADALLHDDKRRLYGAIAAAVISESVKAAVLRAGFFVIEQSGDTMNTIAPKEPDAIRVW